VQELMKLKDLLDVTIVGDRIERPPGSSQKQRVKTADTAKSKIRPETEHNNARGPIELNLPES